VHVHPASIRQVESHPSRLTELKSSHCSSVVVYPSLQTGTQDEGPVTLPPVHAYPKAGAVHKLLQRVEFTVFPSSQYSLPTLLPSPQIGLHTEGITVLLQV